MARPGDWHVLDLERDPTPGDPAVVARLARVWSGFADEVAAAAAGVRSLAGDRATLTWIGAAGEVFAGAVGAFPDDLARCEESYRRGAQALARWSGELEGCQERADRALVLGRQARADLDAAVVAVGLATSAARGAEQQVDALGDAATTGPPAPDPEQVRRAVRTAQVARARVEAARTEAADARSRLDAARRIALDAQAVREDRGRTAARAVDEATEAGLPPRSWWDSVKEVASRVWQATVAVAKVAVVVLALVAIVVGGPLVWGLVVGLSAVLLADTLARYARGEAAGWEVGLAALGCIPGGRAFTSLAELRVAFGAGGALGVTAHLGGVGRQVVGSLTSAVRHAGTGTVSALQSLSLRTVTGSVTRSAPGAAHRLAAPVYGRTGPRAVYWRRDEAAALDNLWRHDYADLDVVNLGRFGTERQFSINCSRCVIAVDKTLDGVSTTAEGLKRLSPLIMRAGRPRRRPRRRSSRYAGFGSRGTAACRLLGEGAGRRARCQAQRTPRGAGRDRRVRAA